ncbi:MAG: 23S rRNA (adenine(2503)-C(2))-methyltransferase RlmN [Candidatus Omnitrophota bacterium]|nr:23S rRNA (adenine(2503)-C(2))-methyltransferase RlmN [Candidatus Omnitrophota bacterium]
MKDLTAAELENALQRNASLEPYRVQQIFRWLYKTPVRAFDRMINIPAPLRAALDAKFRVSYHEAIDTKRSLSDGTTKYLFKLEDGSAIESVFLPERERNTICLSTQVGCKFACSFCASAASGFTRNLSQGEIIDEVIFIKDANPAAKITNLVFMGIGEPLDNYDNIIRAIRIFNDKDAFNIGARKITISTCGVVPGIEALAKEGLQVELSVSLHSADDEVRSRILPVNRWYGLGRLMPACKNYIRSTGRIITFEYVLIDGVNSSKEAAVRLVKLLRGIKCKVNVISYNRIPLKPYKEPSDGDIRIFIKTLKDGGVSAIHRKPKGEDIDAGCGQLRISRLK